MSRESSSLSNLVTAFVLPGAPQLFLGELATGSLAIFGSFSIVAFFLSSLGLYGLSWQLGLKWLLVWLAWSGGWGVHLNFSRDKPVSSMKVTLFLIGLLVAVNVVVSVYLLVLVLIFL